VGEQAASLAAAQAQLSETASPAGADVNEDSKVDNEDSEEKKDMEGKYSTMQARPPRRHQTLNKILSLDLNVSCQLNVICRGIRKRGRRGSFSRHVIRGAKRGSSGTAEVNEDFNKVLFLSRTCSFFLLTYRLLIITFLFLLFFCGIYPGSSSIFSLICFVTGRAWPR
jgi:hypothetical protein